jgi:hypothetical protein
MRQELAYFTDTSPSGKTRKTYLACHLHQPNRESLPCAFYLDSSLNLPVGHNRGVPIILQLHHRIHLNDITEVLT